MNARAPFPRLLALGAASAGALALLLAGAPPPAAACTNFLVTRGASADGSTMITYAADSHELYGELYFTPRGKHAPGTLRKVVEWDTQKPLGSIPQAPETFRTVGNMNEHGVVIGETTFGGRKELVNPKGGIDYGSLIWTALERARTAREAIQTMVALANAHGYKSEGESFSVADPKEVWLLEMVGKGPGVKGALWVARRVPDGYVTAHANMPRIRQFPRNDPENTMYAPDVVSFARAKGWWKGKDEDFSFADVYAPLECLDIRVCDSRVWSFYRRVAPSQNFGSDWVMCRPGAKPLPIWIKPDKKLTPKDLMALMRDHFEGTELDLSKGVGAGPFALPYRWRPLSWKVDGRTFVNERATATQQTGYSFVSQSRQGMPGIVGSVLWFSVDDAASTVYVPIWAGITRAPKPYAVGTGTFKKFSWESAFWVFNWVANFAYGRYKDIIVDVKKVQGELEGPLLADQTRIEKQAVALYAQSPAKAEEFLTKVASEASDRVLARWRRLGEELLVKYLDGNVRDPKGKITHPPYPEEWYRRIVAESGSHFLSEGSPEKPAAPFALAARPGSAGASQAGCGCAGSCQKPAPAALATTAKAAPTPGKPAPAAAAPPRPRIPSQPTKGCSGCEAGRDPGAGSGAGLFGLLVLGLLCLARRRRPR